MQEMDRRVGLLRLLLADLTARCQQTEDARDQLRAQIGRLVDYTVRLNGAVGNALAALADLDERLQRTEVDLRHIELLRRRAKEELDALLVTRSVADLRAQAEQLERRRAELLAAQTRATDAAAQDELAAIEAELAELRATIEAASDAVARALTERRD
jgi:chromosome segregation ATPase